MRMAKKVARAASTAAFIVCHLHVHDRYQNQCPSAGDIVCETNDLCFSSNSCHNQVRLMLSWSSQHMGEVATK